MTMRSLMAANDSAVDTPVTSHREQREYGQNMADIVEILHRWSVGRSHGLAIYSIPPVPVDPEHMIPVLGKRLVSKCASNERAASYAYVINGVMDKAQRHYCTDEGGGSGITSVRSADTHDECTKRMRRGEVIHKVR